MSEITSVSGDSSHSREWISKTHKSFRHRKTRPPEVDNYELATEFHKACLQVFKLFLRYLPVLSTFQINADQTADAKEELGRLYLWGESFGDGGLEKALEQSDEIRDTVLELLRGIGGTLLRGVSKFLISVTQENPFRQDVQDLDAFIGQSKSIIYNDTHEMDDEHEDTSSESDEDEESPDELGSHLINDLKIRIQCLMDLVPTLELNLALAEKERQTESHGTIRLSAISEPAHVYISLVREKYKEANDRVVERLGKANWQRHVAIRRKMDEISAGPEPKSQLMEEKDVVTSVLGPSTFDDSGIFTSVSNQASHQVHMSPGGFYASSVSSNAEDDPKTARIPRMPAEVGIGKPFCCGYCGNILNNIKNRQDWKRHVFADLRPYICTVAGCRDELAQFTSRELWAEHEFNEHRVEESWICPQCHLESPNPEDWAQHIHKLHGVVFSDSKHRIAVITAYKRRERPAEHEQCFLCNTTPRLPRRAFVKHVGQHMEAIALMALPREAEDDSEDMSVTDIQGSNHSPSLQRDSDKELQSSRIKVLRHTRSLVPSVPLKCNHCNDKPNGFRGEHELRRHTERNHSIFRKFWQCVDISPDKKFLAECKACTSGKKYNAYYNAAAHLRRAHFNPRNRRPGKTGDSRGVGAVTEPSMEVLKTWMKEVEGSVPQWNKTAKEFDPLVMEAHPARAIDNLPGSAPWTPYQLKGLMDPPPTPYGNSPSLHPITAHNEPNYGFSHDSTPHVRPFDYSTYRSFLQ